MSTYNLGIMQQLHQPQVVTRRTFTLFPKLPAELQFIIWIMVLPHARLIQPIPDRGGHTPEEHPKPTDPVILQVNQQSRLAAKRLFEERGNADGPCQYFSPTTDTLYFDHSFDFEFGGCCQKNIMARKDSEVEMQAAKNIAIRLRRFKNAGLHFFVWLLSWLTAFPKVEHITVVINDEADPRKHHTKIAEMYCAAETGFENIVQKKNDEGITWTTPVLQVITVSDFAEYWEQRVQENLWPTPTEEESDNLHYSQDNNMSNF